MGTAGKVRRNLGKAESDMAEAKQDFFGNVIGRITELPGAKGHIESMSTLRERMDDLQKRVRGLEGL